jgi:hypothetical protein
MHSSENRRKKELFVFKFFQGPAQILQVPDLSHQFGLAKLSFISSSCRIFTITTELSGQFSAPNGSGVLPQNSPNQI